MMMPGSGEVEPGGGGGGAGWRWRWGRVEVGVEPGRGGDGARVGVGEGWLAIKDRRFPNKNGACSLLTSSFFGDVVLLAST